MSLNKTQPRPKASVDKYLAAVENEQLRQDCKTVHEIMSRTSNAKGILWGTDIVGFGNYTYTCQRKEQTWMRLGYSPRKSGLSVYLSGCSMDGLENDLKKLGKHKAGKGCLNIRKLEDVDIKVLETIIQKSWHKNIQNMINGYSETKKAKEKKSSSATPPKETRATKKKTTTTTKPKSAPSASSSKTRTAAATKKQQTTKRTRSASAAKERSTKRSRK